MKATTDTLVKLTIRIDQELYNTLKERVTMLKKAGKKTSVQALVTQGILWRLGQEEPGK